MKQCRQRQALIHNVYVANEQAARSFFKALIKSPNQPESIMYHHDPIYNTHAHIKPGEEVKEERKMPQTHLTHNSLLFKTQSLLFATPRCSDPAHCLIVYLMDQDCLASMPTRYFQLIYKQALRHRRTLRPSYLEAQPTPTQR